MVDGAEFGVAGPLFSAGTRVPAGRYRRVDAPGRDVALSETDHLPASFDGRVAVYARVAPMVALSA